jgi:hypothetical protein
VAPFYVRRELPDRIHPANALLDVQARLYAISRSQIAGATPLPIFTFSNW